MKKAYPVLLLLVLSLSLLVIPSVAQDAKPPQSYLDAMEAFNHADYKGAVNHFRQTIAERPAMIKAHYYLGLSLLRLEVYAEALDAYRELIKLEPNNILAHYQVGKINLIINDYASSVDEYRWLKSFSESASDRPADGKTELLPEKPGEAIVLWHQRTAGEFAQYLLDLIPRDIAEQYQLQASRIATALDSNAPSCLNPAERSINTANLNQTPPSRAAGNSDQPMPARPQPLGDPNGRPISSIGGGIDRRPPQKIDTAQRGNTTVEQNSGKIEPMTGSLRPTILYREKAKYTEVARINKLQGTVVLNVVFNADGKMSNFRVNRCLPDGLTRTAIEAAQKIRFNPAIKDGTPVSVRGTLEFTFNLY